MSNEVILRCMTKIQRFMEEYRSNLEHLEASSMRKGGPSNNLGVFATKTVWEQNFTPTT